MNSYFDINGNRYTTPQIERKIARACKIKLNNQRFEHGYNFCQTCKSNECKPIDCAHVKSRKWCKENGRVELLWDPDNIVIEGRECHKERDGLNLRYAN